MALFQKRILLRAKADAEAALGLVMPSRCVNSEELVLYHDLHRCPDGILGFFVVFEDEDGGVSNQLLPKGSQKETDFQQFMRFAGLTEVPTIEEVTAIKVAALQRLESEYGPKIQKARAKGPD